MFFRRDTVPQACDRTFEWIWYRRELGFQEWLRTGHGVFWISGKPGSGKSTLLKFLADDPVRIARERNTPAHMPLSPDQQHITATHFFQHGVSALACSIEGLLRSLIWQILLDHAPFCHRTISTLMKSKRAGKSDWSRQDLVTAFSTLLEDIQQFPLCFFIDALDEYAGENGEIAIFLDTMAQRAPPHVRFCVTSRPYPDFSFQFGSAPGFKIHDHTEGDVRIFVQSRFQEVIERDRPTYWKLMNLTIQKAEGVFLWVKLACDELRRGWRHFESPTHLHRHLEEMPKDFEGMYRRIFDNMRVEEHDESCRMLAIVISAARPLTMIEFYHTLVYSSARCEIKDSISKSVNIHMDVHLPLDQLFLPQDILSNLEKTEECPEFPSLIKFLEGRIEAVSRCLLQVQGNRVGLLHETVEIFFQSVGPELVQSSTKLAYLNGDELLLRACINYQIALYECCSDLKWTTKSASCELSGDSNLDDIYVNGVDYVQSYYSRNWILRKNIPFRLSFLFYALDNWIGHACKAEAMTGRAQHGLLEMFSGHSFTVWRALFRVHNPGIRRALPQRLLDIFIESGLDLSAEAVLRGTKGKNSSLFSKELNGCQNRTRLLFSVAKRGSYSVAKSIFDLGVGFGRPLENRHLRRLSPNTAITLNDMALHRAIYFDNHQIVELFLCQGANKESEVESEGLEDWLKFGRRSGRCNPGSARSARSSFAHSTLQRSNAKPGSTLRAPLGGKTWTNRPLEFAVRYNSRNAFFTLLNSYPLGESHESLSLALTAAAFTGRTDYVRALLERGAHPDMPARRPQGCITSGTHTCYALLPATRWGYFDIVELLVSRGANVNIRADLGTCEQYSLSRKSYAGAQGTPLSVARYHASKPSSNQEYARIILLLERSGARESKEAAGPEECNQDPLLKYH
jgi:ankyrin repeat protein